MSKQEKETIVLKNVRELSTYLMHRIEQSEKLVKRFPEKEEEEAIRLNKLFKKFANNRSVFSDLMCLVSKYADRKKRSLSRKPHTIRKCKKFAEEMQTLSRILKA